MANKSQLLWNVCSWAYRNAVGHSISHKKMFDDVFQSLNISKEDIITVFIEEGVLPKNFHSITIDPNFLPKLRNSGS